MPDSQPAMLSPRGIRNNNPGNIRTSTSYIWRGQTGADADGYCTFEAARWGIRAICLLWLAYEQHDGCRTMADYISRWAPPVENATPAYIHWMCSYVGIQADAPLDIHARAREVVEGLITYENGEQPYSVAQITRGITLAHER